MYLLLSGEGASDIGACITQASPCEGNDFRPGPMSWIVDQLVESALGYDFSHLGCEAAGFVSESVLATISPPLARKSPSLRGKKRPAETQYYFKNARALAMIAHEHGTNTGEKVVAVLFRDADGTASAGRGDWANKQASMRAGFRQEGYAELGVPMIANPKSEAWLLCAVKSSPYQACNKLEEESGNDDSAKPLKKQLSDALEGHDSTVELNEMLADHRIDPHKIDMNSFNAFRDALNHAVAHATRQNPST